MIEARYNVIAGVLLLLNLLSFFAYGFDKQKGRKGQYRISERMRMILALMGGSVGAWLGMKFFRQKTMKRKFYLGLPVIILVQAGIWIVITYKG